MPAVRKRRMLIIIAVALLGAGCEEQNPQLQRLKTWTVADWLHDIDAAKAIDIAEKSGELGPPSEELEKMMRLGPRKAFERVLVELSSCYKKPRELKGRYMDNITTANTDQQRRDFG
ncbi:MAG: hypothetical protein LBE06_03835 [Azoarcus sp.]|nr:hypothetical protein [Azoarcus sp.]